MQHKASAPGSMMLLGEYAVLYGKPAIVCALDKRIHATLTPRSDENIIIHSAKGDYETTLSALTIEPPYSFVVAAIKQFEPKMRRGFDLDIESDFSDQLGLGSSSAVTVATLACLVQWLRVRMTPIDLIRQGVNVIRTTQGMGSGADVAASVLGGMVKYTAKPMSAEKFDHLLPITVVYSGHKTPTPKVIQHVQKKFAEMPQVFKAIINSIAECAKEGGHAIRKQDWRQFANMMDLHQCLHQSLGVSLPKITSMIDELTQFDEIFAAKISGSGLGDCIIGLGKPSTAPKLKHGMYVDVQMSSQGVRSEKI